MAKYYLYILLSMFIFLKGTEYFDSIIRDSIKNQELYKSKIEKQKLYQANQKELEVLLQKQKKIFLKNRELFFKKSKKETIVFSEIQEEVQLVMKNIGGKILQLNSGMVLDNYKYYRKYPIELKLMLIPEDLDDFFKKFYKNKKYLFLESIHISKDIRSQMLRLNISLIGYQLK